MRSNRNVRIGIALIAGALVLLLLFLVVANRRAQVPVVENNTAPPVQTVALSNRRVAYALEDIPERSIISPTMFRVEDLPVGDVSLPDYVIDPTSFYGYITNKKIRRNERLRKTFLVGHITDVGISAALRPGTRAFALPIPSRPTFHDIVRVGDTIDVIASFDGQESRTIVEAVRVLAVDVFAKDYPTMSVAQRGDYKAPPRAAGGAPPTEVATTGGDGSVPPPPPTPPPAQPAAPGQPTPTATPTPTPTPPPARPAPAIIVEVTPDQANKISLAQNSGAAVDFLIVPAGPKVSIPGAVAEVSAITRNRLAPYAESKRTSGGTTKSSGGSGNSGGGGTKLPPEFPSPAPSGSVPPLSPGSLSASTYDIPVYVDGKQVRTDTVRKPHEGP